MGKTNRTLLEKIDSAGKCKILLCLFQRQKAKKQLFNREKERWITPKIQCKLLFFLRFLLCFPLPLPTHIESTNPDVHKHTSLSIPHVPCHASARGDVSLQMHRNSSVPIVVLQSDVQIVCVYFCNGKASRIEHSSEA